MADRLYFKYVRRSGKYSEIGECAIDVLDPTDAAEISHKLVEKAFVELLPMAKEYDEEDWSFKPVMDRDN